MKKTDNFTFELFGETWTVEMRSGPITDPDVGEVRGLCEAAKRTIALAKCDDLHALRATFYHEFVHACVTMVTANGIDQYDGWVIEESVAEMVGCGMAQLLRQKLPGWVKG
jgi:hypothetical protein